MSRVVNLADAELPDRYDEGGCAHRRASVREPLGGELIGGTVYELLPGERMWPYHFHLGNEEWLVVVSGRPTLRTPDGERELKAGDLVAFPEGEAGAHALWNATDAPARMLICSSRNYGDAVYPDSDKIGAGPRDDRRYFRRGDAVDYYDGE